MFIRKSQRNTGHVQMAKLKNTMKLEAQVQFDGEVVFLFPSNRPKEAFDVSMTSRF